MSEAATLERTAAHTPGPWYVGAQNDTLYIIDKPPRPSNDDVWHERPDGPLAIARVYDGSDGASIATAVAHRNAKVIAAAPELLDAVKAAEVSLTLSIRGDLTTAGEMSGQQVSQLVDAHPTIIKIRAAIAKAETP